MALTTPGSPPIPPGKKEPPTPLSRIETALATLLLVGGAILIWAVLDIFLTEGEWLVELTVTKGEGEAKTVTTTKYSDTLPLAALGVGGLLILCGAFFGRLREITLPGGAGIKLGDAKEQLEQKVQGKAQEEADKGEVDQGKVEDLKRAAVTEASARLLDRVATTASPPPERELERIAEQAVESAKQLL